MLFQKWHDYCLVTVWPKRESYLNSENYIFASGVGRGNVFHFQLLDIKREQ